ncbi:MAG TPA: DUF541 domain-containing protein [Thermopetrobacter sp.]|nr:DUF541 domain-containing protein [Thermopetrobacter sp.]
MRVLWMVWMLLGLAALPVAAGERPPQRALTLSGMGEVRAAPDVAVVTLGVRTLKATARATLSANNAAMRRVLQVLKTTFGMAERDLMTSGLSIQPRYEQTSRPGQPYRRRLIGYQVNNLLTVRVRALDRLGEALDAVVGAGANTIHGIHFTIDQPEALRMQARRLAVRNAKAKAQLLAAEAGFKVGRVLNVAEGGVTIPRPVYRGRAVMEMKPAAPAAVPVASGERTIRATVRITWEIE